MWSALENAALRESLPTPLKPGDSIHDILVAGQLRTGRYNLHHMGRRRSRPYRLKQFYSLNTDAFLRWQNEARFIAMPQQPGCNWPHEEWRGGLISHFTGNHTLLDWVAESPSIRQRLLVAANLTRQCARLHDQGIAHRNLSPNSIHINGEKITITNFGSARHAAWDDFWTDTVQPLDNNTCPSPERLQGDTCGYNEDVYGIGVLLYLLLANRPPFGIIKRNIRSIFPELVQPNAISKNADLPTGIRELANTCLCATPSHRPLMSEVAEALSQATDINLPMNNAESPPQNKTSLAGKDKIIVFVKDDNHAISLFDAAFRIAETSPSAFLFVGLIPNNLPSGHTERFKGRLFRKLAHGLQRCRTTDIPWSLRVLENVDPERTGLEFVRQYQPDMVFLGSPDQRANRFRKGFHAVLGDEIPVRTVA